MQSVSRRIIIFSILASLVIGYFGGVLIHPGRNTANKTADTKKYTLLAKRLFVESPNDPLINFIPLRNQLNAYFDDHTLSGGVYFEYLPTGTEIRIDDVTEQQVTSLMKLPAAMELYKLAELHTINLDAAVTLKNIWLDSSQGNLYKKGTGYKLTARELAAAMIEKSDATALNATNAIIAGKISAENDVFNAVDIAYTQNTDRTASISPRSYSSLLKCLYFSCYLNHDSSQQLLEFLSKSNSSSRLAAGVKNSSIPIAHKAGVYGDSSQSDCGIVYLPSRNYILCVMLQAPDDFAVDTAIRDISKLTYDYVSTR